MAKEQLSRTKSCAAKTLYAVMQEMKRRGGERLTAFYDRYADLGEAEFDG